MGVVQTNEPEVIPANPDEYGNWYAYTELYFDQPRDMLIALGSDRPRDPEDQRSHRVGQLRRLKGWDIDEVSAEGALQAGNQPDPLPHRERLVPRGFSMTLRVRSRRRRRETGQGSHGLRLLCAVPSVRAARPSRRGRRRRSRSGLRPAAVAGQFYPGSAERLRPDVQALLR